MHFYNELRSKQQTGYLVEADSTVYVSHHDMLLFLVQSSKYKPGDLIGRYEKFIESTLADLTSGHSKLLTKKKFDMIKKSRMAKFKTPNQNIGSVTSLLRTLLENYDGDWE